MRLDSRLAASRRRILVPSAVLKRWFDTLRRLTLARQPGPRQRRAGPRCEDLAGSRWADQRMRLAAGPETELKAARGRRRCALGPRGDRALWLAGGGDGGDDVVVQDERDDSHGRATCRTSEGIDLEDALQQFRSAQRCWDGRRADQSGVAPSAVGEITASVRVSGTWTRSRARNSRAGKTWVPAVGPSRVSDCRVTCCLRASNCNRSRLTGARAE
jgi:hypothetical protein